MRSWTMAVLVSVVGATVASAQMKVPVPQAPPGATATVAPPAVAAPSEPSQESARRITREDAIKMVAKKQAIYVDVRGKEQYDAGHIKGAINLPLGELMTRLKELPPGKFIITYCA